ncbi:MAG: cation-transporting P-type ATPase [Mycobacterium sp.]|nr:cation-transporting P-type ATPase [Mycobacterium sp.]
MIRTLVDPAPALLDAAVVRRVDSDSARGLTARRPTAMGPNDIDSVPPVPAWRKVVALFHGPLIYLLLGALVASVAMWSPTGPPAGRSTPQ